MGSLGRKLKRDLVRSPVKGAVLGLVCLIALWYWAPLLKDWLSGASETPRDLKAVKSEETGESDSGLIVTAKKNVGKTLSTVCNWQTVAKWLDEDPRAKPAIVPEDYRDPFRRNETSTAEDLLRQIQEDNEESTELMAQSETPVDKELEFLDLKLELSGTIVGTHSRSATINGNTYWLRNDASGSQEGQIIDIPNGADSRTFDESSGQSIAVKLVQVHRDHVVLKFQGKEYPLELKRPRLAIGNQIVRRASVNRIDAANGGGNQSDGDFGFLRNVFHWFNGGM